MNKLLKQQVAEYFVKTKEIDSSLISLFQVISDTYDFFENKLKAQSTAATISPAKSAGTPLEPTGNVTDTPSVPFGYAQLIPKLKSKWTQENKVTNSPN